MSDGVTAGAWFAWERSPRGPSPVKYHDGMTKADVAAALARWPITVQDLYAPFNELVHRFPCPAPGPNDLWTAADVWPRDGVRHHLTGDSVADIERASGKLNRSVQNG